DNVLAVRVFQPATGAGILPDTGVDRGKFQANRLMLKGEWLAKAEFDFPAMIDDAKKEYQPRPPVPLRPQSTACYLYNGMIHPVLGYGIRGVIWYQGESNWNRGYQYRTAFRLLINDWRAKWGRGDFPFYYCQIANNIGRQPRPGNDWHSEVREAQTMALSLPNTGQAILIDIGEEGNIHPANKMEVGERLSRIALANTYGKKTTFSGPVYQSIAVEGDKIRVKFKVTTPASLGDGLVAHPIPPTYKPISTEPKELPNVRNAPEGELEGFAICGEDKKWTWATAKIEDDTVLVWNPAIAKPIAIRYAWGCNPLCNLYNTAGLLAGPFRSDSFPLISEKLRYGLPGK
ncbi:MAG TPA: sialate O-acetylesterase, partial [Candidatus Methylacidiphilales bacterium]|nr:sialate O-acetylesterase [Candidatus Methylacidiphilales bacterium]